MTVTQTQSTERDDLLETLETHRSFLRHTTQDITDEQAAQRTTVSALSLGGLIKHVTIVEEEWADFILNGAPGTEPDYEAHAISFQMLADETLQTLLDRYDKVAARTAELVRTLPDLDATQALPEAPWFESGKRWSARRVLMHVIAETAQHAGHADIIRESLDGQKTMG